MTKKEEEICKKVVKMISRMGYIDNLKEININPKASDSCWADVKKDKIHTIEDNKNII